MLTVFKPWRHGNYLRKDEETWDGAFNRLTFSTCQLELIKILNLGYECLDAHDDFHAQMQKGDPYTFEELNDITPDTLKNQEDCIRLYIDGPNYVSGRKESIPWYIDVIDLHSYIISL